MSSGRSQLKSILLRVMELEGAEREAYIAEACGEDRALEAEVRSLMRFGNAATSDDWDEEDTAAAIDTPSRTPGPVPSIPGYKLIRKIGKGGMGVVYKAVRDYPKQTVALKLMMPLPRFEDGETAVEAEMLQRFRFETDVLAKLQHPGIAQIYDGGIEIVEGTKRPWFAMELVRGRPLDEWIETVKPNLRERLRLVRQIAEAVHHAHTRGVVHRDLKPGNILVTDEGHIKVLDFGVAKSTQVDEVFLTQVGQLVGTIPYMSPEQVAGDPDDVDARSDVYSLGVLLYEVLSGKLPYDLKQRALAEAARVIQQVEPTSLSSISRVYRGDIETIVTKALEKDRSRRYQSAHELATDLQRYLDDEPINARPASALYQLRKLAKKNKATAAAVGASAVGLVAIALILTVMNRRLDAYSAEVETQRDQAEVQRTEAERQRDLAERQRALAEGRLADIRDLVSVYGDFVEQTWAVPAVLEARSGLVSNISETLDGMARIVDEPWLARERATLQLRMGDLALDRTGGNADGAEAYRLAGEYFAGIMASQPDDAEAIAGYVRALLGRAASALETAELGQARAWADEAARVADERRTALAERAVPLRARADYVRASLARQARDFSGAEALCLGALLMLRDLEDASPTVVRLRADALGLQARLYADLGRAGESVRVHREHIAARRAVVGHDPADLVARGELTLALLEYAIEPAAQEEAKADSLAAATEAVGHAELLTRTDPGNRRWEGLLERASRDLTNATRRVSDSLGNEVVASTRRQLDEARLSAAAARFDRTVQRRLFTRLSDAANALLDPYPLHSIGRLRALSEEQRALASLQIDEARGLLTEAADVGAWLRLSASDDSAVGIRSDQASVLARRAKCGEALAVLREDDGEYDRVLEDYSRAFTEYAWLAERGALTAEQTEIYATSVRSAGTIYLRREEGAPAVELLELADAILPRPGDWSIPARLAHAYALVGDCERSAGAIGRSRAELATQDLTEARRAGAEAQLAEIEELCADPGAVADPEHNSTE